MSLDLFFAQHVSNASTFIFRSLRMCVGILLWFDVCWRYGVVRLGWCGILIQAGALVPPRYLPQETLVQEAGWVTGPIWAGEEYKLSCPYQCSNSEPTRP